MTHAGRLGGWAPLPDEEIWEAPARLSRREGRDAAGGDWRWARRDMDEDEGETE